jgi:hypothetical protein
MLNDTKERLFMKNFILQNENAVYFECKFSCDNVIFLNLENEKYFITDARYVIEAKEYAKNCEVIESSDLVNTTKEILKKSNIKKIIFDPNTELMGFGSFRCIVKSELFLLQWILVIR